MDDFLGLLIIVILICMIAYLVRFFFKNVKETVVITVTIFALVELFPHVYRTDYRGNLDIIYVLDTTCVRLYPIEGLLVSGWGCYPSYLSKQTINN